MAVAVVRTLATRFAWFGVQRDLGYLASAGVLLMLLAMPGSLWLPTIAQRVMARGTYRAEAAPRRGAEPQKAAAAVPAKEEQMGR